MELLNVLSPRYNGVGLREISRFLADIANFCLSTSSTSESAAASRLYFTNSCRNANSKAVFS